MRTFVERIKRYWDVLGGTIIGLVSSFLVNWKIEKIQLIYSILILILLYIGLLKVMARHKKHKRSTVTKEDEKQRIVDKMVEVQKPFKALHYAESPTANGEELGELIIETVKEGQKKMEKVKKCFKWIWTYREQIVGLLGSIVSAFVIVYAYINDKFGWLLQYFPQTRSWELAIKIGVGLIAILFIYYGIRNQIKWVGIGSLQTAQEYLEQLKSGLISKLSPEAKKIVQNTLKTLKTDKKALEAKISKLATEIEAKSSAIGTLQELVTMGIGNPTELNTLREETVEMQNNKYTLEGELLNLTAKIENYSQALNK